MISFQRRLFLLLTTMIVVSLALLGFFLTTSLSEYINHSKEQEMKHQAVQLLELLHQDADALDHMNQFNHISLDQMMITHDDHPIFKSEAFSSAQLKEMRKTWLESHDKNSYHYFSGQDKALLIHQDGSYRVYLIDELKDVTKINRTIWQYLLLILCLVIPIIYIIVRYINKSYIHPINEVTYASKLLTEGNYKIRVPESSVTETKDLYVSINQLARTLQSLNNEQKLQRNRLETTLQNIPSAILLVNHTGEIVIANDTYTNQFGFSSGGHYETAIKNEAVKRMIKEAIATEKSISETLPLSINIHQKFYDVSVVPVLSKNRKKLEGVVIVMHDITQLKILEQMRKDFVANVSHELKTPITSIKGFSETLLDGAKEDTETLDMFLNIILKEANRIQVLVSELLELSKIEQSNHLVMTKINMADKVRGSVEVVQQLAAKKMITFNLSLDDSVIVEAEPSKLNQVIINLLSNAINYSPEQAEITINVFKEQQMAVMEIIDEGIGIEQHELGRIFERFYRVDKARSRDSGGTGLGLAIVKHIIEVFDGDIEVESQPGQGSTFRVKLKAVNL